MARKRKFIPKSKEVIKEASDIVLNSERDEDAVKYLRETLEDDYPDLDLSKVDLHEASNVLSVTTKRKSTIVSQDLLKDLDSFIRKSSIRVAKDERKHSKKGRKRRK